MGSEFVVIRFAGMPRSIRKSRIAAARRLARSTSNSLGPIHSASFHRYSRGALIPQQARQINPVVDVASLRGIKLGTRWPERYCWIHSKPDAQFTGRTGLGQFQRFAFRVAPGNEDDQPKWSRKACHQGESYGAT